MARPNWFRSNCPWRAHQLALSISGARSPGRRLSDRHELPCAELGSWTRGRASTRVRRIAGGGFLLCAKPGFLHIVEDPGSGPGGLQDDGFSKVSSFPFPPSPDGLAGPPCADLLPIPLPSQKLIPAPPREVQPC